MAKSRKKSSGGFFEDGSSPATLSPQDERTLGSIYGLASHITALVEQDAEPTFAIPARSLGNVSFNEEKRVLQMGSKTTSRELFNLSQAKSFMQTALVASGAKRLIEMGKTTSIRGLYYMLKHD